MRRSGAQEFILLGLAAAVVALAVVPPLIELIGQLVGNRQWTGLFQAPLLRLLTRSLGLAASVTFLTVALGVPLGVLFTKVRHRWKGLLFAAHVSVVFLPPFLPALGWFHLCTGDGWLAGWIPSSALFSEVGVVFVLVSCFTPIVTVLTHLGVKGVAGSLDEAARIQGGAFRAAAVVIVPCARPAITLSAILVFVLSFSELGVPSFLRVDVYPTVVFARLGGMSFAPGEAAAFATGPVAIATALTLIELRLAGSTAISTLSRRGGAGDEPLQYRARWIVPLGVSGLLSALPLASLIREASSAEFFDVLRWSGHAPWNGIRASSTAALVMTGIAVVVGPALAHGRPLAKALDAIGTLCFILPAALLGVGLAFAWNRPSTAALYGSFGILVLGFVARYSAITTRTYAAAIAQQPPSLDDAARCSGAGYLRRLGLLTALCWRSVASTFALGLVFALRDLETVALIYPADGEPLTVRILTLEANGPPSIVAALALLHVLLTFAAISIVYFATRRPGFR